MYKWISVLGLMVVMSFAACGTNPGFQNSLLKSENSSAACDAFYNSEDVHNFIANYNHLTEIRPIWPNYRPENETLVLLGSKPYQRCLLMINTPGEIDKFTIPEDLITPIGYTYFIEDVLTNIPDELLNYFKNNDIKRALIYNISAIKRMVADKTEYEQFLSGLNEFAFTSAIHEGFHLNVQLPNVFQLSSPPYSWPKWVKPNSKEFREAVEKSCYQADDIHEIIKNEKEALVSAYKLFYLYDTEAKLALQAANDFIRFRDERYSLLKDIKISTPNEPEGISCAEAEANMEQTEGTAEFVGITTAYKLNLINALQIATAIEHNAKKETSQSWYYRSGLAQLSIISKLSSDSAFSDITMEIGQSQDWQHGIQYQFEKAINSFSQQ